ncbi:MAG TPA: DNA polymerase Y family protein, partial [Thermomicrobiales bacterium]|nr:DNA polymerase Y family protein [Thermomicrobiales bacterium]
MPIVCVLIPNFPLRLAVLSQPALDGLPLVLTSPSTNRPVVADASPEAINRGIRIGMPLREVHAIHAQTVFIPANPVRDALAFEQILTRLETVSPALEPLEPGRCHVDISGLERHYTTDEEIAQALLAVLPRVLRPRIGLGPTRFTSWTAARMAAPGTTNTITPDTAGTVLGVLPVNWLPLPHDLMLRLDRLGLRTLADIRVLAPSALQARFGPIGREMHAWASGTDEARVTPRPPIASVRETFTLPAPIASREMLLLALRQAVQRAFGRPDLRHRQVRQVHLRIMIEGGQSWERALSFPDPLGPQRM